MSTLDTIVAKIIREQELIIGPIAWIEAKKVRGLDIRNDRVRVLGKTKPVLDDLVSRYARLFGNASVEVCKDAVRPFIGKFPKSDLPASLQ